MLTSDKVMQVPVTATMDTFKQLGEIIEERWRNFNYNEGQFPTVAAEALRQSNLPNSVNPWDIIRWIHATPTLPEQMDLPAKFGDPPLTVYVGHRFFIDVYFWLDGTTAIHQHAFAGAFQVLAGSSVHSQYSFAIEREINPHFVVGQVRFEKSKLLSVGDVREIRPGPDFIHSLFHLDRPSITVTIRTFRSAGAPVQFRYLKPFVALNPFFTNASLTRKIQTAELLFQMHHQDADEVVAASIERSDFHTAFAVLEKVFELFCHNEIEQLFGLKRGEDRFYRLLDVARSRHGELAELLLPVYEENWRQRDIASRRSKVKRDDHRFLLALLLNVPNKSEILKLVRQKFPAADPAELVVDWLKELIATKKLNSHEPNVLGLADFDEAHLLVVKAILSAQTKAEIPASATSLLNKQLPRTRSVEELINQVESIPLLRPLVS